MTTANPPGPWLTQAESAQRVRMSPRRLRRHAAQSGFPRRRQLSRQHAVWNADELDAWVEQHGTAVAFILPVADEALGPARPTGPRERRAA